MWRQHLKDQYGFSQDVEIMQILCNYLPYWGWSFASTLLAVIVLAIVSIWITSWMLSGASCAFWCFKSSQSVLIIRWSLSSNCMFLFIVLFDATKKKRKTKKRLDCNSSQVLSRFQLALINSTRRQQFCRRYFGCIWISEARKSTRVMCFVLVSLTLGSDGSSHSFTIALITK